MAELVRSLEFDIGLKEEASIQEGEAGRERLQEPGGRLQPEGGNR